MTSIPPYSDTDKATVILLDSNGERTDQIQQFSASEIAPLTDVRNTLGRNPSNNYDVILGEDFMTNYPSEERGVIQNLAFNGFKNLVGLEIYCTSAGQGSTYVYSLGAEFCANCTGLKHIVLPHSLRYIPYMSFYNCTSLEGTIKLPSLISDISHNAFGECSGIQKIELRENVTGVDKSAFANCSSLKEIKIYKPKDSIQNAPWTWNGSEYNPADVKITWGAKDDPVHADNTWNVKIRGFYSYRTLTKITHDEESETCEIP